MSDENMKAAPQVALKRRSANVNASTDKNGTPIIERPPLREDSRAEAARVAAELRARFDERPIGTDPMDVKHLEPDGWTYQWHTWSIYEQMQNRNIRDSEARGWRPVPLERHPHLMPPTTDLDVIMDKGCILMQLPTELVNEYRQAEIDAARNQVRWKEEALSGTPHGTMTRDHAQARPKINKSFEAMPIPD